MLKTQKLYEKVKTLQAASRGGKLKDCLQSSFDGNSLLGSAEQFFAMIDEARFEVESCVFVRDEKNIRYLQELSNFRAQTLERFITRDQTSTGPLFNDGAIERLGAIADSVGERIVEEPAPLARKDFVTATERLIKEVKEWDIDEYASRSLLLGLGLIVEMANSKSVSVSDAEIRRRIQRVTASFAVEFAAMDKEFETRWEKVKRWARLGYRGASAPLGLTSDAASVAGLLPKP